MMPIYLDYAATTPVAPSVIERMLAFMGADARFGNPASRSHAYGWQAEDGVEQARQQVAAALCCDVREVIWTSGATESNNLAIKGVVEAGQPGAHLITARSEHKAVLDCFCWLERRGHAVSWLTPDSDGRISPAQLAAALRDDTALVSLMHANNETGVINDIAALGALCRERGVLFHVDAAQTAGKLPLDLATLPVDLLSLSAHKFYGPKGVGMLYVRRHPDVRLLAQIHGGGHERGLRSGTLASHQVVGLGAALALAEQLREDEQQRLAVLRDQLWQQLAQLDDVYCHGLSAPRLAGHLNVAFAGLDADLLLTALPEVALSSGSACTSATIEPSHVLTAMGVPRELALASLRFSLGRHTSEQEVARVAEQITRVVPALRARRQSSAAH